MSGVTEGVQQETSTTSGCTICLITPEVWGQVPERKNAQGGELEVKITVSLATQGEWGPQENIDFPHTPPPRCL